MGIADTCLWLILPAYRQGAQRGSPTCPGSHSSEETEPNSTPGALSLYAMLPECGRGRGGAGRKTDRKKTKQKKKITELYFSNAEKK